MSFLKKYGWIVILAAIGIFLFQKYRIPPKIKFEELHLSRLDGSAFSWEEAAGKSRLLNFFQTWCGPCLREMPGFINLQQKMKSEGLIILCISDEPVEKLRAVQEHFGPGLLILHSKETMNGMGVHTWPTTYLISDKGEIIRQQTSAAEWDDEAHQSLIFSIHHTINKNIRK